MQEKKAIIDKIKSYITVVLVSTYAIYVGAGVVAQFYGKSIIIDAEYSGLVQMVVGVFIGYQTANMKNTGGTTDGKDN